MAEVAPPQHSALPTREQQIGFMLADVGAYEENGEEQDLCAVTGQR
jgi:hypothetical protein